MIRRSFSVVAGLLMALPLLFSGLQAARADTAAVTLHGIVTDVAGKSIAGAFVSVGTTVQTDRQGRYTVQVDPSAVSTATVWAAGYNSEQINLQLPSGLTAGEAIGFDFSGQFGLSSAFVSPTGHARLLGLPPVVSAADRAVWIHGTSLVPLEPTMAVTRPNGRVSTYPLTDHNGSFVARLPFHRNGAYRIEINAVSGFSVFNVLVFRGVTPFLPSPSILVQDPAHATAQQLTDFTIHLLNVARHQAGLKRLHPLQALTIAATRHTRDLVDRHYFFLHPHIGSNGSTPLQRIQRVLPGVTRVGETIGEASSVSVALNALLDSPSHRAIILGHYHWIGVAVARDRGNVLVTIDFAH